MEGLASLASWTRLNPPVCQQNNKRRLVPKPAFGFIERGGGYCWYDLFLGFGLDKRRSHEGSDRIARKRKGRKVRGMIPIKPESFLDHALGGSTVFSCSLLVLLLGECSRVSLIGERSTARFHQ